MLHGNSKLLIKTLEESELLEGRYSKIRLVNIVDGEKRGHFSLVFRATDEIDGKDVALKFLDPDPSKSDQYRSACFRREHEILESLRGAARCLQVRSSCVSYELRVAIPEQNLDLAIPAPFFAAEWIEGDIDKHFESQEQSGAIEKLEIFNLVVLAVEGLHKRGVFHRDIKADNFRSRLDGTPLGEVVAIDLGTSARSESKPIAHYTGPVGLLMYSAPEAFCGMAGDRAIAPHTDMFALGCMLFEMFHPEDYQTAYRAKNPDFDIRFSALKARIDAEPRHEARVVAWEKNAPKLFQGLSPVKLDAASSAPAAISGLLSELIDQMTRPDFRSRESSFERVRRVCHSAIRTLSNEALARHRSQQVAKQRQAKAAKAIARAERSRNRLAQIRSGGTDGNI
ncbi:protein kinase domain-containing protein [Luteimonas deserti]|uniref:non-specific serine/threonine protein kinase n=1 Tax=Luteimonas deserti TaxID=2752306 RepID=A0A7Z0QMY7_9GAMM|nr:hypothetical protein [Luteimonas deserti]NYZ61554.1 hypothetical protein [Luteimonas deserti]